MGCVFCLSRKSKNTSRIVFVALSKHNSLAPSSLVCLTFINLDHQPVLKKLNLIHNIANFEYFLLAGHGSKVAKGRKGVTQHSGMALVFARSLLQYTVTVGALLLQDSNKVSDSASRHTTAKPCYPRTLWRLPYDYDTQPPSPSRGSNESENECNLFYATCTSLPNTSQQESAAGGFRLATSCLLIRARPTHSGCRPDQWGGLFGAHPRLQPDSGYCKSDSDSESLVGIQSRNH